MADITVDTIKTDVIKCLSDLARRLREAGYIVRPTVHNGSGAFFSTPIELDFQHRVEVRAIFNHRSEFGQLLATLDVRVNVPAFDGSLRDYQAIVDIVDQARPVITMLQTRYRDPVEVSKGDQ